MQYQNLQCVITSHANQPLPHHLQCNQPSHDCNQCPRNLSLCICKTTNHFGINISIKMPKLRVSKSKRIKDLPTDNPYKYAEQVEPIYEVHRVSRKEMVELPCRQTHCIKARSTHAPENDNLYELFTRFTNKDVRFLRQWLKLYAITNKRNLEK